MQTIAVFGGTFDPIHKGHLQTSIAVQNVFHFDSYRFIPCKSPTLKSAATANPQQRMEMLQRAIANYSSFEIDPREIDRDSPSYMVDTLATLREEYPEASITLILGYDAFNSLSRWHQWEKIITLAHLLVINRNACHATSLPAAMDVLLKTHQTTEKKSLLTQKAGCIYKLDAGDYPFSSTEIRTALKKHQDVSAQLSREVYEYIKLQGLYQ